jgi:hypothetical protein
MSAGVATQVVADLIALSDERDLELRRRLEAWREGWRAAEAHLGEQYEAGYVDGLLARKRIQHAGVRQLQLETLRWDGPREDFGRPRPGDYAGGSLPLEHPGQVYLAGPAVHWPRPGAWCNAACSAFRPGWYGPAEAVAILTTLPHDCFEAIDRLRGQLAGAA